MIKDFFHSKRFIWYLICLICTIISRYFNHGFYENAENYRIPLILVNYLIICPITASIFYWIGKFIYKIFKNISK